MASIADSIRSFVETGGKEWEFERGGYSEDEFQEFIETSSVLSWGDKKAPMVEYLGCRVTFTAQTPRSYTSILDGSAHLLDKRWYMSSIQQLEAASAITLSPI